MSRWVVSALIAIGVASLAYWRKALTRDGAAAAAVMGAIVFSRGGLRGAATLITFFVTSTALSRVGHARKQGADVAQAKGAQRDAWQVLANGGVAAACIALGAADGFAGALAAAGADTWATELGMLAEAQPRLITTLERVPRGTSGGVTLQGLAASAAGAATVGLVAGNVRRALLAGLGGSLLDSLLGATLQARYRCTACGAQIEEPRHRPCDADAVVVGGHAWITNDTVNAAATLLGATIAHTLK